MFRMRLTLPALPRRDALLATPWLRPFAPYLAAPVLWRWNRHPVARGLALGLFVGILIPLVQSPFAALLSLVARANLPVAVVATLVTNPLTTPFVFLAAYQIGDGILATERALPIAGLEDSLGWLERLVQWLAAASLPTAIGLLVIATAAAVLGYATTHIIWRWRVSRRWRARPHRARITA